MISHAVNHCIEARCLLRGRILQLLGPFNGRRLLPGAEGTSADGTGPTLSPTENPRIQQIFVSFEITLVLFLGKTRCVQKVRKEPRWNAPSN